MSPRPSTLFDWLVPGVIFAFCAIVTWFALQFDEAPEIVVGPAMQPRSFPIFLAVIIALLLLEVGAVSLLAGQDIVEALQTGGSQAIGEAAEVQP